MGINSHGGGITTDLLARGSPLQEDAGNMLVVGYAFGLLKWISWLNMGEYSRERSHTVFRCASVGAAAEVVTDKGMHWGLEGSHTGQKVCAKLEGTLCFLKFPQLWEWVINTWKGSFSKRCKCSGCQNSPFAKKVQCNEFLLKGSMFVSAEA